MKLTGAHRWAKARRGASELSDGLGRDLDEFTGRGRRRDGLTVFFEAFQMKFNCLMNQSQNFVTGIASSDATGKVGNVGSERSRAFFNYYQVSHFGHSYFLRPACFRALLRVPGGHIYTQFSGHRDCARFLTMVILAVTSFYSDLKPTIGFEQGG
jgi:hypothetical protein